MRWPEKLGPSGEVNKQTQGVGENVRALHCRHVAQPSAVALLSGCAPTRQRPLSYQGPEESKHLRLALAGA
ncbi:hypothetical protein SKAU_G00119500 [Synaphobranchus kaupii]|uniref:Uncharacterized protein n=1 Tax=Synaphobranchus kaupii TaxID=118154 RepID=A0A9Q1FNK5_SYNKA|nr:hypothetical protein SKAU_G00119500 [Synaphobranchus kaupii]